VNNVQVDLREVAWNSVGWIGLAQYTDQWKFLMNTVMTILVSLDAGNFLVVAELVAYRAVLSSNTALPAFTNSKNKGDKTLRNSLAINSAEHVIETLEPLSLGLEESVQ
jgi:hypothetical protein